METSVLIDKLTFFREGKLLFKLVSDGLLDNEPFVFCVLLFELDFTAPFSFELFVQLSIFAVLFSNSFKQIETNQIIKESDIPESALPPGARPKRNKKRGLNPSLLDISTPNRPHVNLSQTAICLLRIAI
jgi:hypothetical protein